MWNLKNTTTEWILKKNNPTQRTLENKLVVTSGGVGGERDNTWFGEGEIQTIVCKIGQGYTVQHR